MASYTTQIDSNGHINVLDYKYDKIMRMMQLLTGKQLCNFKPTKIFNDQQNK